jgi:peptidyl-prolyl cis-trans isomerase D
MDVLEKIRHPGRGRSLYQIVGYTLLVLICISFAFIGLSRNTGQVDGHGVAATVNSEVIPVREFRRAVEMEMRQFGDGLNKLPAAQRRMFEGSVRKRALESLVASEVLFQSARGVGFLPADGAVRDQIVKTPVFQEEGRFSRENYGRVLEANGWTPGDYENLVRRQMVLSDVREVFDQALRKSETSEKLEKEARSYKLNLEFVRFEREKLDLSKLISAADVKAFLATTDGAKEAETYFQTHKEEWSTPKEVKARHILVKLEGRKEDEALEKIKGLKKTLTAQNFSDVAKAQSEDAGSKDNGGDLGFFGKGKMVPEFETVAMNLPVGQISEPVKSPFGYHLILVDETKGGVATDFNAVKEQAGRKVLVTKKTDQFVSDLEKSLAAGGKDLGPLLQSAGLKWSETGDFTLADPAPPKLEGAPEAISEAMKAGVGQVVQKLLRSEGQAHVIRLKSIRNESAKVAVKGKDKPDENPFNPFAMQASMEALGKWAEVLESRAKVKRNDLLLDL